jgi:hypothetical protein
MKLGLVLLLISSSCFAAVKPQEKYLRSFWLGQGKKMNHGFLVMETMFNGRRRVVASHFDGHVVTATKRLLPDDFDVLRRQVTDLVHPVATRERPTFCPRPMMFSLQRGAHGAMERQYVCVSEHGRLRRGMASVFAELK